MADVNPIGIDLTTGRLKPLDVNDTLTNSGGQAILGSTGIQGVTGVLGLGATGIQGVTGVLGGGAAGLFLNFNASQGVAPSSNFATFSSRNLHGILNFDQTTPESIIFESSLPNSYNSGANLILRIYWTSQLTTGDVVWSAAFEAIDDSLDIDSDGFAAAVQASAVSTNATSGIRSVSTLIFNNSEADSIAAGSPFRLQITRVAGDSGDTLAGDAQFLCATVEQ